MLRRAILAAILTGAALAATAGTPSTAQAAPPGQPSDWQRFYYYPYVYYPQTFSPPVEFDHMYYRYPQERQIPVYNKQWYNFYPTEKPYHKGHHFILDVF